MLGFSSSSKGIKESNGLTASVISSVTLLLRSDTDIEERAKASLHSSLPPSKKSGRDQLRIGDPPARQGPLLNQQIPPGILLGFPSSSKGIKESNGLTASVIASVTLLLRSDTDIEERAKASLHSSLPPSKKSGRDQLRIGDPPARQGPLLNQQIPPGILLGLSSPLPRGSRNPTA